MGFLVTLLAGRVGSLAANAIVYGVVVLIIGGTLLGIRQHYVNEGWRKHAAAVEKQDGRAIETNRRVEATTQKCTDDSGFWDVITQSCKLQDDGPATEGEK